MPPVDRRPPLAVSPCRLRPRRNLTAISSDLTLPATAVRSSLPCDRFLRAEHPLPIPSWATKMSATVMEEDLDDVLDDLGASSSPPLVSYGGSPLFERGRFYELYSARRNERLKRRNGMAVTDETVVAHDAGVAVELARRRYAKKAVESVRKSVPTSFAASRASSLRSSVRTSKEMKKSSAAAGTCQKPNAVDALMRTGSRRI